MGLSLKYVVVFHSEVLAGLLPHFKGIAEKVTYPAIKILTYGFLNDLYQKSAEYGITDKMKIGPRLIFVFMGKLISLYIADIDIDVCDEDEQIWSVRSLSIETTNKEAFTGFYDLLARFVSGQNYQEIIRLAAEELKKEKIYHLDPAVRRFYGL